MRRPCLALFSINKGSLTLTVSLLPPCTLSLCVSLSLPSAAQTHPPPLLPSKKKSRGKKGLVDKLSSPAGGSFGSCWPVVVVLGWSSYWVVACLLGAGKKKGRSILFAYLISSLHSLLLLLFPLSPSLSLSSLLLLFLPYYSSLFPPPLPTVPLPILSLSSIPLTLRSDLATSSPHPRPFSRFTCSSLFTASPSYQWAPCRGKKNLGVCCRPVAAGLSWLLQRLFQLVGKGRREKCIKERRGSRVWFRWLVSVQAIRIHNHSRSSTTTTHNSRGTQNARTLAHTHTYTLTHTHIPRRVIDSFHLFS